jgi:hypothetical protein
MRTLQPKMRKRSETDSRWGCFASGYSSSSCGGSWSGQTRCPSRAGPFDGFQSFSIWRRRVPLRDLDEMTVLRPCCGLQVVLLDGRFGSERLLFHSRNARMKFFEAVKAKLPDIRIYRTQ